MSEKQTIAENNWFYENDGQRKGPVSESEIIGLIKASSITKETPLWKEGFSDWMKLENTDLSIHIDKTAPPPLSGAHINNAIVWVLAFAPLIGYVLEWIVASVIHGGNEYAAGVHEIHFHPAT